jgi:hypothetical protein
MHANDLPLQLLGLLATASAFAYGVCVKMALARPTASRRESNAAAVPVVVAVRASSAPETGPRRLVDATRTVDANRGSQALGSVITTATPRRWLSPMSRAAESGSAMAGLRVMSLVGGRRWADAPTAGAARPAATTTAPPDPRPVATGSVATERVATRPLGCAPPAPVSPVNRGSRLTQLQASVARGLPADTDKSVSRITPTGAQPSPAVVARTHAATPPPIPHVLPPTQTPLPIDGVAAAGGGAVGAVASSVDAEFVALASVLASIVLRRFSVDLVARRSASLVSRLEHPG